MQPSPNPYDPSGLSPLPVSAQACALPYGLTWPDLAPALPGFDPRNAARPQAFLSHRKQGLNGGENSCILTLRYPAGEDWREQVVFVKHMTDPQTFEAGRYAFLAAEAVPVPQVLAAVQRDAAETIVLEFLPTIGINFSAPHEVDALLHLTADINAISSSPGPLNESQGMPQDQFDAFVRAALNRLERDPYLSGSEVRVDAARWFRAYQSTHAQLQGMPRALTHNQLYFHQVGWSDRPPARRLVVFDLETLTLAPRFSDICGILQPLSHYAGRDPLALFSTYLEHLEQRSRRPLDFALALRELRQVRVCAAMESVDWLVGWVTETGAPDAREALAWTIGPIQQDLDHLGL